MLQKIVSFFKRPFFQNFQFIFTLWIVLAMAGGVSKYFQGESKYGNYINYKTCFLRVQAQEPIYEPVQFSDGAIDYIHYGPVFSVLIAPFAMLPNWLGILLWLGFLAAMLFWAIRKLPLKAGQQAAIFWICMHELLTAAFNMQFNIGIAAIIVLAFVFIEEKKEPWAAFVIMLGAFIKLYGIVGLAFFFFSKQKKKFILFCILWSVVFFILPMFISSPEYIIEQYVGWFNRLMEKNSANVGASIAQNISLIGMIQRIFGHRDLSMLFILLPGLVLFALPYLRVKQYKHLGFRLMLLASVLMFTVLFSTGSESSTYIITFVGVAVWFVIQPKPSAWHIFLLVFVLILSSFSPSDLFPSALYHGYVAPYALKALPCALVWLTLCYEICTKDFTTFITKQNSCEKNIDSHTGA